MCTAKRVSKVLARMGYRTNYDSIRDYIFLIWDNSEIVVQCLYGWYTVMYIDALSTDERARLHTTLMATFIYDGS